jgi:hypothetical protein
MAENEIVAPTTPEAAAAPAPEVSAPEVSAPEVSAPEVSAPEVSAPVPGDISALAQPGPSRSDAIQTQMAPYQQAEQAATQKAADIANTPTAPPKPVPHARLLAMISGLATGLGAASTSIATHGREGGAQEVTRVQGEQQQQKQAAAAAVEAQKNTRIQQQLMVADTNHKLAQNVLLMATLSDELIKSHASAETATTGLAEQKFNLFAGTGMNPADIDKLTSGGPVDAKTSGMLNANAQQQYRIASQLLPADNPSLAGLKAILDSPGSSPAQLVVANKRLQAEVSGQKDITADRIKQAEAASTAPFGPRAEALNAAMTQRYQVLNPGKPLPSGLSLSAESTPKDFDRVDKILQQTENAQGTQANRNLSNNIRQEMLNLAEGAKILGDTSKTGDEYLASLPIGLQGTVRAIGEARQAPPPSGSRNPAAQSILGALNYAYPHYDATKYPAYVELRKAFTSGKEAVGINAFNTVAGHLSLMYDHAKATATLPGVSGVSRFFGNEAAAALNSDRQAVSTELAKAYAGGQLSEGEINQWNKRLNVWSPVELRNNIKEVTNLLQGKLDGYKNQWASGMPTGVATPIPLVSSAAQTAFDHIHGKTGEESQTTGHKVGDSITQNGRTFTVTGVDSTGKVTGAK